MNLSQDFSKIIKEGQSIFSRNSVITIGIVVLTSVTLFMLGLIIFLDSVVNFSIAKIEDRIDINVSFFPDIDDRDVKSFLQIVGSYPEVADAKLNTASEILEDFRDRHEDNFLIIQSLEEIRGNPFGAMVNIRAIDPQYYETISRRIYENSEYSKMIEKVNFYDNEIIITRLKEIADTAVNIGVVIMMIIGVLATLLIFNATRLAIANSRGDIKTKILLGSEPRFIRGPFLMAGFLYAVIATFLAMVGLYILIHFFAKLTRDFLANFDLMSYFVASLPQITVLLLCCGIILSMVAAWVSVSIVSQQK